MNSRYDRDRILDVIDVLAAHVAAAVSDRLDQRSGPEPEPPPNSGRVPEREWLTMAEAVEWTGLSKSGINRARANGLPSSKALGRTVFKIDDLRALLAGHFNRPGT